MDHHNTHQPFLFDRRQAFGSPYFWLRGSIFSLRLFLMNYFSSVNLKKLGATSINHLGFIEQTSRMYYFVVKTS